MSFTFDNSTLSFAKRLDLDPRLIKRLEDLKVIYKLKNVGGSYAVLLPKTWVEWGCFTTTDDEGNEDYWVMLDTETDKNMNPKITLSYPNVEFIKSFAVEASTYEYKKSELLDSAISTKDLVDMCRTMLKQRGVEIFTSED